MGFDDVFPIQWHPPRSKQSKFCKTAKLSEIHDIDDHQYSSNHRYEHEMTYEYKNPSESPSPLTFKWDIDTNPVNKFKDCRVGKLFEIYDNV